IQRMALNSPSRSSRAKEAGLMRHQLLLIAACLSFCACNKKGSSTLSSGVTTITFDLSGWGYGPPDLAAVDLAGNYAERASVMNINGRVFGLQPIHSLVDGVARYSLQVGGEGVLMVFSCEPGTTTPATYSFGGDTITVCGGVYTIVISTSARRYSVN